MYFLRINGDTIEKIICCILVGFFASLAKLLPSCSPLALGELKVVLAECLHCDLCATVVGWEGERAKKRGRLSLLY